MKVFFMPSPFATFANSDPSLRNTTPIQWFSGSPVANSLNFDGRQQGKPPMARTSPTAPRLFEMASRPAVPARREEPEPAETAEVYFSAFGPDPSWPARDPIKED